MNGYNVILITDTSSYPQWLRDFGVHRLASHIRENGYTCLVIDFCSEMSFEDWEEICRCAVGPDTMTLGFGSTWWGYRKPYAENVKTSRELKLFDLKTPEEVFPNGGMLYDAAINNLIRWIDVAKKINPNIKTIMGGAKIDHYVDGPFDHFFVGLSETQIIDFLDSFKGKKRLWPRFIEHDTTAQGCSWDFKHSMTTYIEEDCVKPGEYLSIEFARGCRFKCSFCAYPLIGRKDVSNYLKDKDVLYREFMDNYEKWGVTSYRVADDTLNDSTEKLLHLESVIKRLPFKVNFCAFVRSDVVGTHPEQIELLKNIGLFSAWIGVDSFHPVASKIIGKGQYAEKKKETLYKMKEAWGDSINMDCGYIVGLPQEDSKYIREVAEWVISENSPVDRFFFTPLMLHAIKENLPHYPQSEMDRNYQKYGYEIPNKEQPLMWVKDDGTDIKSFMDAAMLAEQMRRLMAPHFKPVEFGEYYKGCYTDPKTEYFPQLVKILQNKFDNK